MTVSISPVELEHAEEQLRKELRKVGMKWSSERGAVLHTLLQNAAEPVSASEFHFSLKRQHPNVSFATVYRTLKTLVACGMAKELEGSPDGITRYTHQHPETHCDHQHLVCKDCGAAIEK